MWRYLHVNMSYAIGHPMLKSMIVGSMVELVDPSVITSIVIVGC